MKPGSSFIAAAITLFVGATLIWSEALLYSQNTLYLNDHWVVQKRKMLVGLMGSNEFLVSRSTLSRNQLDLGKWFGYQEVITKKAIPVRQLEFVFELREDSYLDVTFNRGGSSYPGLRFALDPKEPLVVFGSSQEGKFLSRRSFPLDPLSVGRHRVLLEKVIEGLRLQVDGGKSLVIRGLTLPSGQVGFRGGREGAWIGSVVFHSTDGGTIREDFHNGKGRLGAVLLFGVILLLLGLATTRVLKGEFYRGPREALLHLAAVSSLALLIGGAWLTFDFRYWSEIPFQNLFKPLPTEIHHPKGQLFESIRYRAFAFLNFLACGETVRAEGLEERGYSRKVHLGGLVHCDASAASSCHLLEDGNPPRFSATTGKNDRILFVGTSQTVGVGAESLEKTSVALTHEAISRALPRRVSLESLNLSTPATNSLRLFQSYTETFDRFSPSLAVLVFSTNDRADTFEASISKYLDFNRSRGVKTVLVAEANDGQGRWPRNLSANHEALRTLGRKYEVPVLEMHAFLARPEVKASGVLWWDFVHLTSHGQSLVAQWLAPILMQELKR